MTKQNELARPSPERTPEQILMSVLRERRNRDPFPTMELHRVFGMSRHSANDLKKHTIKL